MPARTVHHADAMEWLAAQVPIQDASFVTSLPDVTEMPDRSFSRWEAFFTGAASLIASRVAVGSVAIFFQSDIKHEGRWVDKGYMVQRAVEGSGMDLLWHKIMCRKPAGVVTRGRSSYSHLLCFGRGVRADPARSTADVLPEPGIMTWSRAMGTIACAAACRFILEETQTRTVIDPFCGHGTVLAVANQMGMDAVGVDVSVRKCRKARALRLVDGD